mgnify:CR=1 FL=1
MSSSAILSQPSLGVSRVSIWRRRAVLTIGVGVVVGGIGIAAVQAGYRVNVSPSEPMGVWRQTPAGPVKRGDMVSVCVPLESPAMTTAKERGYILPGSCPGNLAPLVTPIAAVAGGKVTISTNGLLGNSAFVTNIGPADRDSEGRPLKPIPYGIYTVPKGAVFLVSDYSPKSFDSRYFGFVPTSGIRGGMKPVWVSAWKPKGF